MQRKFAQYAWIQNQPWMTGFWALAYFFGIPLNWMRKGYIPCFRLFSGSFSQVVGIATNINCMKIFGWPLRIYLPLAQHSCFLRTVINFSWCRSRLTSSQYIDARSRQSNKDRRKQPYMPKPNRPHNDEIEAHLVNVDIPAAQLNLGLLDLFLQFLMRFWDVVERQDRHTQPAEQVAPKGY